MRVVAGPDCPAMELTIEMDINGDFIAKGEGKCRGDQLIVFVPPKDSASKRSFVSHHWARKAYWHYFCGKLCMLDILCQEIRTPAHYFCCGTEFNLVWNLDCLAYWHPKSFVFVNFLSLSNQWHFVSEQNLMWNGNSKIRHSSQRKKYHRLDAPKTETKSGGQISR